MLGIVVATAGEEKKGNLRVGAVTYNVVNRRSRKKRRLPPLETEKDLVYQQV